MKDLTKIKTAEIWVDEKSTQDALSREHEDVRYPELTSVFSGNINGELFSITANIPAEYNATFKKAWAHLLVRPVFDMTPSYMAMSKIADTFFNENEYAMQVIPKRSDYISREEYTLHLWSFNKHNPSFLFKEVCSLLDQKIEKTTMVSRDSNDNRYLAIVGDNWPSWEQLVQLKETHLGTEVDAVIVNRSFAEDTKLLTNGKKVVIIWEVTEEDFLPDSFLV